MTRAMMVAMMMGLTALPALPAARADEPSVNYGYLRGQVFEVKARIREDGAEVVSLIRKHFPEDVERGTVDIQRVQDALSGLVTADGLKAVLEELACGAAGGLKDAQQEQARLDRYRAPLDAMDMIIKPKQAEYDRMLDTGWEIDFWGIGGFEPRGTYGERMRELFRELRKLNEARTAKKNEIDARIQADPDVTWKGLDRWQEEIDKAKSDYLARALPGHRAIQKLLAELSVLIEERDRITRMLDYGGMFLVWTNDVGWLYVGTREEFLRQAKRTRGDEVFGKQGPRANEPLTSTLVLDTAGYTTIEKAVQAVGEAVGTVELRIYPLTLDRNFYVGKLGGKEVFLKRVIVNHPAFKPYLPRKEGE